MNLFKLFLILFISNLHAQTSGQKVLFLDLNNNPQEIEVAKKAADAKGQKLIVYPQGMNIADPDEIKKILKKHTFSSIVLSGHNGGSTYEGDKGVLEVTDLINIIQNSSSAKKIQSLYLLGCNGANKSKIYFWKESLPELKFIAGYDGLAPLGHDARGLRYFEDALTKEDKITSTKNFDEFKNLITNLNSVNNFASSVYASCSLDDKEYLFLPERSAKERFTPFDASECVKKISEFKTKYFEKIKLYWSGDLEPTELNPKSGFLRDAYVFLRQNEHCISDDDGLFASFNGDKLLFLRFMKAFNENFIDYYNDELKVYLDELNQIINSPEEFGKKVFEAESKAHKDLIEMKNKPQKYKRIVKAEIEKIEKERKDFLKADPVFARCIASPIFNCPNSTAKYIQYQNMSSKISELENIENTIDVSLMEKPIDRTDIFKDLSRSKDIKRLRDLVDKSLKDPRSVTRRELLAISHIHQKIPTSVFYGKSLRMTTYLYGYESLEGTNFPFSWHERIPNRQIEDTKYDSNKNNRYFESRFPKEFESLSKLIDSRL